MVATGPLTGLMATAATAPAAKAALASQEGAGGPDILELALLTMGAIFGAAAVGLIFYLLRLRLGFWLHRPPTANPDEHPEHH